MAHSRMKSKGKKGKYREFKENCYTYCNSTIFLFLDQYSPRSHILVDNWHIWMHSLIKKYIVLLIVGNCIIEHHCSKHLIDKVVHFLVKKIDDWSIEVMLPNVKSIPKYLLLSGGGLALLFWICFCYRTPFNFLNGLPRS